MFSPFYMMNGWNSSFYKGMKNPEMSVKFSWREPQLKDELRDEIHILTAQIIIHK